MRSPTLSVAFCCTAQVEDDASAVCIMISRSPKRRASSMLCVTIRVVELTLGDDLAREIHDRRRHLGVERRGVLVQQQQAWARRWWP